MMNHFSDSFPFPFLLRLVRIVLLKYYYSNPKDFNMNRSLRILLNAFSVLTWLFPFFRPV
jgi:hypothetical protein